MSISKRDLANEELCQRMVDMYLSEEKPTIQEVATSTSVTFHTAQAAISRALSKDKLKEEQALRYSRSKLGKKNPMAGRSRDLHHSYKGRLFCDPYGYVLVLKPDWYTGRQGSKHIYEHSVVMAQMLGLTEVPEGLVVHHIDENRANNHPDNLALVTAEAHRTLHARSPLRRLSLWELHRSGTSKLKPTTATLPTD